MMNLPIHFLRDIPARQPDLAEPASHIHTLVNMPPGLPAEGRLDFAAIQFQEIGLMGGVCFRLILPGSSLSPVFAEQVYQFAGGNTVTIIGAYIVKACIADILILLLGNGQVDRQRLQNVLIGAGGLRIADTNGFSCLHRPDAVRDDTVVGKIPAANDVARPSGGHRHIPAGKKAVDVAVGHQF